MNLLALGIAACSAVCFAVSTSLQHHANGELPEGEGALRSFSTLARRPGWLLGQGIAASAFALHSVALSLGLLVLVQPVVVSGIVLAVPVRAALAWRLPRRAELGTVALTAVGLGMFLLAADPSSSRAPATHAAMAATGVGAAIATGVAMWASRRRGVPQATGYGLACGVLFGLTAGLVKLAAADASAGSGIDGQLVALLTAWPTWAVVLTGLAGMALNQCAYRAGPLTASMPLLNVVDVLVAIAFGILVFDEIPAHGLAAIAGQGVALGLMAVGLLRLARSEEADVPEPSLLVDESVPGAASSRLDLRPSKS